VTNAKNDYELVAQVGRKKAWEVFLNTYKTGFYADLAREQLAKLGESGEPGSSATPPKVVASLEPPPPPEPVKPTSDESRAWSKLKDTSDKGALEKFIARYPNSPLALNAQSRLDVLERAAREREEKARAEREASQQRAEEARQRAEEARRAKETREAALRAENEQRAKKEAPESEKQKIQDQAARDQLACNREQARLDDLKAAGNSAPVRRSEERRVG